MNAIDYHQPYRIQIILSWLKCLAPARGGRGGRFKGLTRLTTIVLLLLNGAIHRAQSQLYSLVNVDLPGPSTISRAGVYTLTGKLGLTATPTTGQDHYSLAGLVKSVSVASQNPSAPQIFLERMGADLAVSWARSSANWRLESAVSLTGPTAWTAIPPEFYQSSATHHFVRLPPTNNCRFFRLKFQN